MRGGTDLRGWNSRRKYSSLVCTSHHRTFCCPTSGRHIHCTSSRRLSIRDSPHCSRGTPFYPSCPRPRPRSRPCPGSRPLHRHVRPCVHLQRARLGARQRSGGSMVYVRAQVLSGRWQGARQEGGGRGGWDGGGLLIFPMTGEMDGGGAPPNLKWVLYVAISLAPVLCKKSWTSPFPLAPVLAAHSCSQS